MNLFNCYQALAFYTAVPLAIQYLYTNDFTVWAVLLAVGELIGFGILGLQIYDK